MIKELNTMSHFIKYDLMDEFSKSVELTDLESIGVELLDTHEEVIEGLPLKDVLQEYISILNFIENESSIPTPVSDDTYDQIVEKYKDLGGRHEVGVHNNTSQNKKFGYHKYPELRGSLDKIHYLKNDEIPEKDSRKSFQQFLSGVIRELNSQGVTLPENINAAVDLKWDGTSHILEFSDNATLDRVLTRYDVENNMGVDITHIFKGCDLSRLLFCNLPVNIYSSGQFGLKVETFMPSSYFDEYVKYTEDKKCNRRSAITSIVNKGEDEWEPSLLNFLVMKPLQIASLKYFELSEQDTGWIYLGELFGRHQYIHIYSLDLSFKIKNLNDLLNNIDKYPLKDCVFGVQSIAAETIPVDGAVITLLDQTIIDTMGRKGNKNKFQIAFKFPQGVKKTTLKSVEFPVGPVAGTITPLAIVDPVVINGNTITNATLSNFEKMERLDLNIGDEVIIRYDIIPKLEKDDSCKKGRGIKIQRPTNCPVCNSDLQGGNRCVNPDCDAKLAGKIYNYIRKLKIKNIGKETIEKFVGKEYLKCIGDLYRLPRHVESLTKLPGFGVNSITSIFTAIFNRTKLYPHELLGAIGIPDISIKTMQKVCENMDILTFSEEQLKNSIPLMTDIQGIGKITAEKIVSGMINRFDLLEDVMNYIEFIPYPKNKIEPTETVLFTECRDSEFAEYLEENNVEVASNYVKRLTLLIVPNNMDIATSGNKKVLRAKDESTPILTLNEARIKFGYMK